MNSYKFDVPNSRKSIIKVMGVGGGGGNAVNYMYTHGISDVDFIVCNTDAQVLKESPIPNKLQIGSILTEGLGAGTNPEIGRKAAEEDEERIKEMLQDSKMIFITAGMGGGTGTGAAPVIAKYAKEKKLLTVGIVTMPFSFEGPKKKGLAEEGIREMKQHCDTVVVILNDKIKDMHASLGFRQAFAQSDNIITEAARSISEIVTKKGFMNVDFKDVYSVMHQAGAAVMGTAVANGPDRALRAAEEALHSPLLNNTDIKGATKILVSITAKEEGFTMDEFTIINNYFQEAAGMEAMLKAGMTFDESLGDHVRVTIIATGFEDGRGIENLTSKPTIADLNSGRQTSIFESQKLSTTTVGHIVQALSPKNESPSTPHASTGMLTKLDAPDRLEIPANKEPKQYDLFSNPANKNSPEVDKSEQEAEQSKQAEKNKSEKDYIIRKEKITSTTTFLSMTPEEHKQRLDVPAFIRRNKELSTLPHSSEAQLSVYTLSEDSELLGNNKFLHDRAD